MLVITGLAMTGWQALAGNIDHIGGISNRSADYLIDPLIFRDSIDLFHFV
jgi:hypothetical protein